MGRAAAETLIPAALIIFLYYVLPFSSGGGMVLAVGFAVVVVVCSIPWAIHASKRVMESSQPILHGAQMLALMLSAVVCAFASVYYAFATHYDDQMTGLATKLDAMYFTLTMSTTIGFGDIHPIGQAARGVASFHMVSNLAVVAVGVQLVRNAISHRRQNG
jgi:voltage-gated potassium channel